MSWVMQTALQKKDVRLMYTPYGNCQPQMQHIRSSPRPDADACWYRCALSDFLSGLCWLIVGSLTWPAWPNLHCLMQAIAQNHVPLCHDPTKRDLIALHTVEMSIVLWPQRRKGSMPATSASDMCLAQ